MSEHIIKLVVTSEPSLTSVRDKSISMVEEIFRNPQLLREAPPYALSVLKKELKKFSCKSMAWNEK